MERIARSDQKQRFWEQLPPRRICIFLNEGSQSLDFWKFCCTPPYQKEGSGRFKTSPRPRVDLEVQNISRNSENFVFLKHGAKRFTEFWKFEFWDKFASVRQTFSGSRSVQNISLDSKFWLPSWRKSQSLYASVVTIIPVSVQFLQFFYLKFRQFFISQFLKAILLKRSLAYFWPKIPLCTAHFVNV